VNLKVQYYYRRGTNREFLANRADKIIKKKIDKTSLEINVTIPSDRNAT
jgi:hypothetical protein